MCSFIVRKSRQLVRLSSKSMIKTGCLVPSVAEGLEVLERARLKIGDMVAIWGGDYMALLLLQLVKKAGATKAVIIDDNISKREMEFALGATDVIHPNDPDFSLKIMKLTDFYGFDCAFETSGLSRSLNHSASILTRGGRLITLATAVNTIDLSISAHEIQMRNISIDSVFLSNRKLDIAEQIADKLCLEELISNEFEFLHANKAFETFDPLKHYKFAIKF